MFLYVNNSYYLCGHKTKIECLEYDYSWEPYTPKNNNKAEREGP